MSLQVVMRGQGVVLAMGLASGHHLLTSMAGAGEQHHAQPAQMAVDTGV